MFKTWVVFAIHVHYNVNRHQITWGGALLCCVQEKPIRYHEIRDARILKRSGVYVWAHLKSWFFYQFSTKFCENVCCTTYGLELLYWKRKLYSNIIFFININKLELVFRYNWSIYIKDAEDCRLTELTARTIFCRNRFVKNSEWSIKLHIWLSYSNTLVSSWIFQSLSSSEILWEQRVTRNGAQVMRRRNIDLRTIQSAVTRWNLPLIANFDCFFNRVPFNFIKCARVPGLCFQRWLRAFQKFSLLQTRLRRSRCDLKVFFLSAEQL